MWSKLRSPRRTAAWLGLLATAALLGGSALVLRRAPLDRDLLASLAPEARTFLAIDDHFGTTRTVFAVLEASDVLEPRFFSALARATARLDQTGGVELALSLSSVDAFTQSEAGGIETDLLVRSVPEDQGAREALWSRILDQDMVVGQLVSRDRQAAILYVFPSRAADPVAVARRVREIVTDEFPGASAFGGAPFLVLSKLPGQDSAPAIADRLLDTHFGGSTWVQVEWSGDLANPEVLRALDQVADEIGDLPGVVSVQHIGQVVASVNGALSGETRIPDTEDQVKLIYRFIAGKPAVQRLVTADRRHAVFQIRLAAGRGRRPSGAPGEVIEDIARTVANAVRVFEAAPSSSTAAAALRRTYVARRVLALAKLHGLRIPEAPLASAIEGPAPPPAPSAVAGELDRQLRSGEGALDLSGDRALSARVARELVALGPSPAPAAISAAISGALTGAKRSVDMAGLSLAEDLADDVRRTIRDVWRRARRARQAKLILEHATPAAVANAQRAAGDAHLTTRIADALGGLDAPTEISPAEVGAEPRRLEAVVSDPMSLEGALSRAADQAQRAISIGALASGLVAGLAAFRTRSRRRRSPHAANPELDGTRAREV